MNDYEYDTERRRTASDGNQYPATKHGHTFSGVCRHCDQPIYTAADHAEGCLYGA